MFLPILPVTYTVGHDQPLHPDLEVNGRMVEYAMSDCPMGCKVYADPKSNLRVKSHNSNYNCYRKGDFQA